MPEARRAMDRVIWRMFRGRRTNRRDAKLKHTRPARSIDDRQQLLSDTPHARSRSRFRKHLPALSSNRYSNHCLPTPGNCNSHARTYLSFLPSWPLPTMKLSASRSAAHAASLHLAAGVTAVTDNFIGCSLAMWATILLILRRWAATSRMRADVLFSLVCHVIIL